jgi:hypothetical protein
LALAAALIKVCGGIAFADARKNRPSLQGVTMYFIMLCWASVVILLAIAFMRRLW